MACSRRHRTEHAIATSVTTWLDSASFGHPEEGSELCNRSFDGRWCLGGVRRGTGRLLRVLVLVVILKADLVNVLVRVAIVPVRVLVGDVVMLVAVMGVRVRMVMMRVLVVVWFLVIVLSVHLLSFHVGIREMVPAWRWPRPSPAT